MARLVLRDSNKNILETLEVNNEVLDHIQEAFKTIVYEDDLTVPSFQEAHGISGMRGLHNNVVDDFSPKVDLLSAQETVETIDANHMQMTKYGSKDDPGYRAVSGVLKAFIKQLSRLGYSVVLGLEVMPQDTFIQ
ncbi:hypothetical protein MMC22_010982 [Lobaria immixta]|nr:hypothetical protein [Lobaria immixta]